MTFSRNDMTEDALIEISKAQRAPREVAPVTSLDILDLARLWHEAPEEALKLAELWSKSK